MNVARYNEIDRDCNPMLDHPTLSSVSRHLLEKGLETHLEEKSKDHENLVGGER